MIALPDEEYSNLAEPTFPQLQDDIETDVVIVGGGITGLHTAYVLKQAGLNVVVLEKNNLASGTTGGTTGKVTSQHSLIYADLARRFDDTVAQLYGQANQRAIDQIEQIVTKESIDCDWERADNYVYTAQAERVTEFKTEADIAARIGLPASFETTLDLPFDVAGAVKFANQAKFYARNYVLGLAKAVNGNGSFVFENSEAENFNDNETTWVKTDKATVTAKHIVLATKVPPFPLMARFSYCFYEFPTTSYIVSSKQATSIKGMYISPDKNHYSILPISGQLLIGGENHLPALPNHRMHYQKLADYGAKYFGMQQVDYMWRAMDYLAYDGIPMIGKLYLRSKNMYVATAFQKWGLTTSMVAANIFIDQIIGRPNDYAEVFKTNRMSAVTSMPRALKQLN